MREKSYQVSGRIVEEEGKTSTKANLRPVRFAFSLLQSCYESV
jgi:hypothetical protein